MDRLLVGRTLDGRYEIQEVLGRGGMSVVFRGRDLRLDREVAIKVVGNTGSTADRANLRARFRREAAAAARIPHHPHVVQVYDYGTDAELDIDYIVMELLQGRDLKHALAEGGFPLPEAVRVLADAARGIAAGHRAGVVHRDVKPANILLPVEDGREQARVVDFGIAKPLASDENLTQLTVAGHAPYSPAYASREQLAANGPVTPASDVYQLGLLGYEMLAGERPFSQEDRERISHGETVAVPVRGRWASVPLPLQQAVSRALSARPEHRFADAQAMADALDKAAADAFRSPRPASTPGAVPVGLPVAAPTPARTARSRRPPFARVPALVAGLFVLLVIWALARRGNGETNGPDPAVAAVPTAPEPTASQPEKAAPGALEARTPPREGTDAAADVMRTVADANRAWVDGDLREHISHYASWVDYYNSKRLPRSGVLRDRRRDLNRYPEREIVIERQQVEFPEPGRARVLADKRWRFGGGERERRGQGLQEYVLKQDDGRWYIVSEQLLEEVRSERRVSEDES